MLLVARLREAIRTINLDQNGQPWLDDRRINQAIGKLERVGGRGLMATNKATTELLLTGIEVEGDPVLHSGKNQTIHFIDYQHPDSNNSL